MTAQTINTNRFTELDFVRAIAVVAVVAIHVTSITLTKVPSDPYTAFLSLVLNQLSRFCVPAFLFVSGILAFHSLKRDRYLQLLKGKLKSLMIPYVVWTMVGLLFFLTYLINYKGIMMIFVTGNGPFYQLYYIPLLFQMFVILPLMLKLTSGKRWVIIMSISTLILFAVYQVTIIGAGLSNGLVESASALLQSAFVGWIIYFYMGILAAQNYPVLLEFIRSKSTAMFVVIYVISAIALVIDAYVGFVMYKHVESMNYFRVTVFIYSITSIALLIKLGMTYKRKVLTNLYTNSFGIYLIHVAIIKMLFLISSVFFTNSLFIIGSIVLTIIISYWIVELIKRTPVSFLLLGQKFSSRSRTRTKPLGQELER